MPGRGRTVGGISLLLLLAAAGCASPPKSTLPRPATDTPDMPAAAPVRPAEDGQIVALAREYLGTPYRYGGSTTNGMDCSGLVLRVYKRAGYKLPRTSASQFGVGQRVEREQLQSGDLVFFVNSKGRVNHVGIYAGGDRFIHASTSKRAVRYDSLSSKYFRSRFAGGRRIVRSAR